MSANSQYQIGVTSLFISALGMVPFKDNFWSQRFQPGNKYCSFFSQFSCTQLSTRRQYISTSSAVRL